MADCRACGATIDWAEVEDTEGQGDDGGRLKVPLDRASMDTSGDHRYTVTAVGPPMLVRKLNPDNTRSGFMDHRLDCPDYGDGGFGKGQGFRSQ